MLAAPGTVVVLGEAVDVTTEVEVIVVDTTEVDVLRIVATPPYAVRVTCGPTLSENCLM